MVMHNGDVFAIGGNVFGCLGVPGVDYTYSPVKVDALSGQDVKGKLMLMMDMIRC